MKNSVFEIAGIFDICCDDNQFAFVLFFGLEKFVFNGVPLEEFFFVAEGDNSLVGNGV